MPLTDQPAEQVGSPLYIRSALKLMSQMGWAYGTHGEKNEQRTFVGKPETRRPLETPRIRLEFKFKKGEIFPVHSMKAYKGNGGRYPLVLNLGTRWRCVVNFTFRPLYRQKKTHSTGCVRGCVGLWFSMDVLEKARPIPLPGLKPRFVQAVF